MSSHNTVHLRKKKNGKWYRTAYWQTALRKHSVEKMKVRILQKIQTDKNTHRALNIAEREWILIYRTNEKPFGYNMDNGGNNPTRTPEWNANISNANKGRKHTGQALVNMRAGYKKRSLSVDWLARLSAAQRVAQKKPEVIAKKRSFNCKVVIATDTDGNETEYYSASEASRQLTTADNKFHVGNICRCCQKKSMYKGYTFRYKN